MTVDVWGELLRDELDHGGAVLVLERDDGYVEAQPAAGYLAPFRRWPPAERQAMRLVRGRVLDVGCGAGRAALHLQERGHEVVAVDSSPGAVEVAARRGVADARVLALRELAGASGLGTFDTVLLFGNNVALLENMRVAPRLLRELRALVCDDGRLLVEGIDPYQTVNPDHLAYHARNRERGRTGGELRVRLRYRRFSTPWTEILFVSREEVRGLAEEGGWRVERVIPDDGPLYFALLSSRA